MQDNEALHPGEILLNEYIKPLKLSQNRLARDILVSPRRINEIVLKKRSITPDTSIRLGKYFGVPKGMFLRMQNRFDLKIKNQEIADIVKKIPVNSWRENVENNK